MKPFSTESVGTKFSALSEEDFTRELLMGCDGFRCPDTKEKKNLF